MTGLVILTTGVWSERVPTEIVLSSGDISYLMEDENGAISPSTPPQRLEVLEGIPQVNSGDSILAWHGVRVEEFFEDYNQEQPFTGAIHPVRQQAVSSQGTTHQQLYGMAVENGAPLTALAFRKGLSPLGSWGGLIVLVSVLLFATSTAISWSYYGDCCAQLPFRPQCCPALQDSLCADALHRSYLCPFHGLDAGGRGPGAGYFPQSDCLDSTFRGGGAAHT